MDSVYVLRSSESLNQVCELRREALYGLGTPGKWGGGLRVGDLARCSATDSHRFLAATPRKEMGTARWDGPHTI